MKDKRSWVKRTATRGLDLPAVWALARIADETLISEAERIAEFRARQAEQVDEEPDVIDVIDEAPRNEFVVGIGSEGCVFGTLELQIKECFIPNFINGYRLQEISKFARQAAEFVNLYSKHRGTNRYAALVEQLRLLRLVPEVRARGIKIPVPIGLIKWLEQTPQASNRALEEAAAATSDPDLELALKWSKAVNKTISQVDHGVPPYPYARETLKKLAGFADVLVVSNMPNKLLTKEWQQHELAGYVKAICGREAGSKAQSMGVAENFPEHHALMVGDSYYDLAAARTANCLFFPINPGAEEASWRRLYEEGVDRFLTETFAGPYQDELLVEFERHLPAHPAWLPQAEAADI
ncbi:MAG: HAD family hydrolase [Planctomycetales bacterium]|nr:HAD family hydrolase [Planctomycetales bacterium]